MKSSPEPSAEGGSAPTRASFSYLWQGAALALVAAAALGGSYGAVYALRSHREVARLETAPAAQAYPTGEYLTAYMIMSSKCHFCTSDSAKTTIRGLRAAVRRAAGDRYARVSVVGVAIDPDVRAELQFIQSIGAGDAFDQISIGGGWLNHLIAELSWQDGFAEPAMPQIVFTERRVDGKEYPDVIRLGPPTLLYHKVGEGALAWIDTLEHGGSLPF